MKGFLKSKLVLSLAALVMSVVAIAGLLLQFLPAAAAPQSEGLFQRTNLVSDIAGVARFTDPNLVNSWGLSHSPTGPWRISDNGTGLSTSYKGNGKSVPPVVIIPTPKLNPSVKTAAPTGNVFNNVNSTNPDDFVIKKNGKSGPSIFMFATEDGTISGWNPAVDETHAILKVDLSVEKLGKFVGAVYKGLAIGRNDEGKDFIYATNFRSGMVDMFNDKFQLVKSFTDTILNKQCDLKVLTNRCFAPFGIQNIKGQLFVTFALQLPGKHDDNAGPGRGFVDIFDTNGNFIKRLISHGPHDELNSPWGLALAPANFGKFSNELLVGNFGDGHIHAFDPATGALLGQLKDQFGPIVIDGLWGLAFGNGDQAGPTNVLFFAAGIAAEAHGLFGSIEAE